MVTIFMRTVRVYYSATIFVYYSYYAIYTDYISPPPPGNESSNTQEAEHIWSAFTSGLKAYQEYFS